MEFFSPPKDAFEDLFSRTAYLGPLREYPQRYYTWEGEHQEGVGQYGQQAVSAQLSARVQRRSIDERILDWLRRLELIYSYDLHPVL